MVIVNILFTLSAAFLPGFIWLIFFLKEDPHPEPKRLIIYAFNMGVLVSLLVLASQIIFQTSMGALTEIVGSISALILMIAGLACIEEAFKFFAAYWAINNDPAFDEPVDAMIYMIAAALGFATVENFFILLNIPDVFTTLLSPTLLKTVSLRFVGATLLHTLSSGLVGYYWARSRQQGRRSRILIFGLIAATLIHAFFNYLIISFQDTSLIYPSIFLILAAFFVLNDFEKLKTRQNSVL